MKAVLASGCRYTGILTTLVKLTRIALPVKVVLWIAVAAEVQPRLLARRAMREGHVIVCDIIEEVDLILPEQEAGGNRVDGRVAPAFVEEATVPVQGIKVVDVGLGPQPAQAANLKVGPLRKDWSAFISSARRPAAQ